MDKADSPINIYAFISLHTHTHIHTFTPSTLAGPCFKCVRERTRLTHAVGLPCCRRRRWPTGSGVSNELGRVVAKQEGEFGLPRVAANTPLSMLPIPIPHMPFLAMVAGRYRHQRACPSMEKKWLGSDLPPCPHHPYHPPAFSLTINLRCKSPLPNSVAIAAVTRIRLPPPLALVDHLPCRCFHLLTSFVASSPLPSYCIVIDWACRRCWLWRGCGQLWACGRVRERELELVRESEIDWE